MAVQLCWISLGDIVTAKFTPFNLLVFNWGVFNRVKAKLGVKTKYRQVSNKSSGAAYALKEVTAPYNANFDGKKAILKAENRHLWGFLTEVETVM